MLTTASKHPVKKRKVDKNVKLGTPKKLDRKRGLSSKLSNKDKVDAVSKKLEGETSKKDLELFLKLANKEKDVLERKIAVLESVPDKKNDAKLKEQLVVLKAQRSELLEELHQKEKQLLELGDDEKEKKRKIPTPGSSLKLPSGSNLPTRSPKTGRKLSLRSPSPMIAVTESAEDSPVNSPNKTLERKKRGKKIEKADKVDRDQQTTPVNQVDEEVQVEMYDEGEDDMYNQYMDMDMGGGSSFMFQEPGEESSFKEPDTSTLHLGSHVSDTVVSELEGKVNALEKMREKDMEKISVLSERCEHAKQEITSLSNKASAYYGELETVNEKLNTSYLEITKLTDQIRDLKSVNSSLCEQTPYQAEESISEDDLKEKQDEIDSLKNNLLEKNVTIMNLHQELHEATEEVMDRTRNMKQLEIMVDHLKHDNNMLKDEQMSAETTNEEVLDKLRSYQMKCNQLEEMVRSLEGDVETQKQKYRELADEKSQLQQEGDESNEKMKRLLDNLAGNQEGKNLQQNQQLLDALMEAKRQNEIVNKSVKKQKEELKQMKKEAEKTITGLQTKLSRRNDDIATLKDTHNNEKENIDIQVSELQRVIQLHKDVSLDATGDPALDEASESVTDLEERMRACINNVDKIVQQNFQLKQQLVEYSNKPRSSISNGIPRLSYTDTTETDVKKSPGSEEDVEEDEDFGEISIALVLYSYDPATMSPNEYPEDELTLVCGDFVYIFGDPDEDGFYTAELMDGRRGLVPSNFVQVVDLNEKKTQQMRRMSLQNARLSLVNPINSALSSPTEYNKDVPTPRNISIETIDKLTIRVTWEVPESDNIVPIFGFKIFINNQEFKSTSSSKCKSILKNLPSLRPLSVALQTVSAIGYSGISQPTLYGKDSLKAPWNLEVTSINEENVVVTFVGLPHCYHGVSINNQHVITLEPGVFMYQLKDLKETKKYDVSITASSSNDVDTFHQQFSQTASFAAGTEATLTTNSPLPTPPYSPDEDGLEPPTCLTLNMTNNYMILLTWFTSHNHQHIRHRVHLNDIVIKDSILDNEAYVSLSQLSDIKDEQSFHVTSVNIQSGIVSAASNCVSFLRTELFTQLSEYYERGRILPESIHRMQIGKVVRDLSENSISLVKDQLIIIEKSSSSDTFSYHPINSKEAIKIPPSYLEIVPIVRRVVALYEYKPSEMSPNDDVDNELAFLAGDVILIFEEQGDFYRGILKDRVGLIPSNFVIDLESVLNREDSTKQPSDFTQNEDNAHFQLIAA